MWHNVITFNEGYEFIQKWITKLTTSLDGSTTQFSSEDIMRIYTTIYNMCTQPLPNDYSRELYDNYSQTFQDYIISTVVPSIREKQGELMLREVVKRWSNHKIMVKWMSRCFNYLDCYYTKRSTLPTLHEVGLTCFRELVYHQLNANFTDALIHLIDREREGEEIDRELVKNVIEIYVEIEMGSMRRYEEDFEARMLQDTAAYYSRNASIWISDDASAHYLFKAEECLNKEKDRVSHYLHSSTEPKLLEKVQHELLVVHANPLLDGFRVLLKDDKIEDLSRMYRLYYRIPNGLEHVSALFKQHIIGEGDVLVQQAQDSVTNQVVMRKIIELHGKCMGYLVDCFQGNTLFHKAMKEAFEIFCNKTVAGSSITERRATFCDDILNNDGDEKLSDEAIEETIDKIGYNIIHHLIID